MIKTITQRHQAIAVLADQFVVSGGNFLATVICARSLGIHDFGVFSACWLVILLSSSVLLGAAGTPLLSNYPLVAKELRVKLIRGTLNIYWCTSLTLMLFICATAYLFIPYQTPGQNNIILLTAGCAVVVNLQEMHRRVFIAQKLTRRLLASDLTTHSLRIALISLMSTFFVLDVEQVLVLFLASSAVAASFYQPQVKHLGPSVEATKFAWRKNKEIAKWLVPSGLMQWTSVNLFVSTSAFLLSPSSVAEIRVCQTFANLFGVFVQAAENHVPIVASSAYVIDGHSALMRYVIRTTLLGGGLFGVVIALSYFIGSDIVELVFGREYKDASVLLIWVLASQLFVFIFVPLRAALKTLGVVKIWFIAYLIASSASILSVTYLLENYQEMGVVLGMLGANVIIYLVATISLNIVLKRIHATDKS